MKNNIQICFPNDDLIDVNMESFAKNIKEIESNKEFSDVVLACVGKTYMKFKTDDFKRLKRHVRLKNIIKE